MIDALRLLLDENESTLCAFLCDSSVQRVTKLKREGALTLTEIGEQMHSILMLTYSKVAFAVTVIFKCFLHI